MTQLILIALATFASEDLTCIAAGVLIAQGRLSFVPGVLACLVGIFAGDLLLYFAGRLIGRPLLRWKPMRRLLPEDRIDRASAWLAAKGAGVVVASRFTPGLRLPTYVAAGLLRTHFFTFAGYFLLAAVVWTPLLVGTTVLVGERVLRAVFSHSTEGTLAFLGIFGGAVLVQSLPRQLGSWRLRRRALGFLLRKVRWEFWPPWAAYLPLAPYLLYLAAKHRSATLFTAANPGILTGGLAGESKSAILAQLGEVPAFTLLPSAWAAAERIRAADSFRHAHGLDFPVVLKPDVGERGTGVAIVRSRAEMTAYLQAARVDTILQQYICGLEFGLFYARYPEQAEGRILSITQKRFPAVTGDGRSTVEELVLADPRAVCLAGVYLARCRRSALDVPACGERVPLAELGSHCRGAIFLDGAGLATEALRAAVDRLARRHPGFYFGRFDVRAASVDDLRAGRFSVLELNGVGAEATHIYDPAVSLAAAYGAMFTQWRMAFEIGARNTAAGAAPMGLRELLRILRSR